MPYITPVPRDEATGLLKEQYDAAESATGYIPNYLKVFSHRPEVYQAWQTLLASIRTNMTLRRYELVTLAAARRLQGTYCMLAHGNVLLKKGEVDEAQLTEIATNYQQAGLTEEEVAIMAFAEKVIAASGSITQADVDSLRSFGLTDAEVLDITLAATARSFFSKTIDALNAEPDGVYAGLQTDVRLALTVGRTFDTLGTAGE